MARSDDRVVAVSAAMIDGTGLRRFNVEFPDKTFDVGIAEQNAVAFASGLALNGLKPVVALYSTFLQRAYDQVLSEVGLQNLPIVFAVDRAGITGKDGETHQGQFDISYLNLVPNMTILSPRDETALRQMLRYAFSLDQPVAIRYPRGNVPKLDILSTESFVPEPQIVREGKDIVIFTDGNMFEVAMKAAEILEFSNISSAVCDLRILKPLDRNKIEKISLQHKCVVTIEDGTIYGGVGSTISSILSESGIYTINIGWPDKYIQHGSVSELRQLFGLDADSVAKKIKDFYEEKTGCFTN
ncbi:MAG: transketolase C-terminal domain-containing protein [Bacillota bacterium]|nr:transketolase C-terminal domain-containing protein [Bacillota bacterium]